MKNIQDIIKKAAERYDLNYNENGTVPIVKNFDGTTRILTSDFINEMFKLKNNFQEFKWTKSDVEIDNYWNLNQRTIKVNEKSKEFTQFELAAI